MLANTSRLLRLSLIAAMAAGAVAAPVYRATAWAQDDDDEDDGGDDGGDEGGGGDDEGGGGDDEGGGEEEEEEAEEGQPPVTAGGNFTKSTYPQAELERPLTITKGMTEVKAGVGFDLSSEYAFESVGALVEGRYGLQDNAELQLGFKGVYNFSQIDFFAGFEGSIVYDLVDFRAAARMTLCEDRDTEMGKPPRPPFCVDADPDKPGRKKPNPAHVDLGFPFRYAPKPQVAVVALETLMTIDLDSKPDLNPSVGVIVQPIPLVAVMLEAQLQIIDFKTDAKNFRVPATLTVQLSPTNKIDLGLEFTLQNIKGEATDVAGATPPRKYGGPFDDRFLTLYGQLRL